MEWGCPLNTVPVSLLRPSLFSQVVSPLEEPITVAHIVVEASPITDEESHTSALLSKLTQLLRGSANRNMVVLL